MIVGGYELHLYCRFSGFSNGPDRGKVNHQYMVEQASYSGNTSRECVAEAKRDGWKFSGSDVTCPTCVKNKAK